MRVGGMSDDGNLGQFLLFLLFALIFSLIFCHDSRVTNKPRDGKRVALGTWRWALGRCRYGCRPESSAMYFRDEGGGGCASACVCEGRFSMNGQTWVEID